jgi:hypothetical protein
MPDIKTPDELLAYINSPQKEFDDIVERFTSKMERNKAVEYCLVILQKKPSQQALDMLKTGFESKKWTFSFCEHTQLLESTPEYHLTIVPA